MSLHPLLLPLLVATAPPSPYLIPDPAGGARVDYLVVAADGFVTACDPLLALREAQGLKAGLVPYSAACAAMHEPAGVAGLVSFLRHVQADWGVRYVLLVGGAVGPASQAIPMSVERARYHTQQFPSSPDLATDFVYSALGGEEPVLHVGRFPARSPEEAAEMVARTVAYETATAPGLWQRRVSFFAGQFGMNPMVDATIESIFARTVAEDIPPEYDVEVAYAKPESPYCPSPSRFHANAVRLLNQGSLLCAYVGHGMTTGWDSLQWRGQSYPILDAARLAELDMRAGPPVLFVIACWTGRLDMPTGRCVSEAMLNLPGGPVAILASSRICQPYGNALLGKALVGSLLGRPRERLGDGLDEARSRLLARDDDGFRRQVDSLAALVQGAAALPGIRADTIRHYNLLGDPALLLRRPTRRLELQATRDGDGRVVVTGTGGPATGHAIVTVECRRDKLARPLQPLPPETDPGFEDAMNARYLAANDKAYAKAETRLEEGKLRVELALPAEATGPLLAKAFAWGEGSSAVGCTELPPL